MFKWLKYFNIFYATDHDKNCTKRFIEAQLRNEILTRSEYCWIKAAPFVESLWALTLCFIYLLIGGAIFLVSVIVMVNFPYVAVPPVIFAIVGGISFSCYNSYKKYLEQQKNR